MKDESIGKLVVAARVIAAVAVTLQSALFLRHAHGALEQVIGILEIIAAILFLIPVTLMIGASLLISIFAFAGIAHQAVWLIYPTLLVLLIAALSTRRPRMI